MLIGLISNTFSTEKNNLNFDYKQIMYKRDIEDLMTFDGLIINMESVLNNLDVHNRCISSQFTENLEAFRNIKRPVIIIMPNNSSTRFDFVFTNGKYYKNQDIVDYLNVLYPEIGIKQKKYTQFNNEIFDMNKINVQTTHYIFNNLLCIGSARNTNDIVFGISSKYNALFVPYINSNYIAFKLFSRFFQKKPIELSPAWIKDIFILNEEEITKSIDINNKEISSLQKRVIELEKKLKYYSEIKSILYTSGDYLEQMILRILKDEFKFDIIENDVKNENDIIVKCNEKYLVIEVKGVKGSITSKHVMQADKWKTEFILKNIDAEPEIDTKVKALIIANPKKDTPIGSRIDDFPKDSIRIAASNNVSIISTTTLLNLLEDLKCNKLSKEHFFNVLYNKKALVNYTDFFDQSKV